MSAADVVVIVIAVFFLVGVMVGIVVVYALSARRAHEAAPIQRHRLRRSTAGRPRLAHLGNSAPSATKPSAARRAWSLSPPPANASSLVGPQGRRGQSNDHIPWPGALVLQAARGRAAEPFPVDDLLEVRLDEPTNLTARIGHDFGHDVLPVLIILAVIAFVIVRTMIRT